MDEWDEQTSPYSPLLIAVVGTHVLGIDRRTGKRIWDWDAEDTWWGRMAFARDRIIVAGRDRLACLAHDTGKKLWDVISPVRVEQTFLVYANEVVVGWNGEIATFDVETGKLLWHDRFEGYGSAAVSFGFRGFGVAHPDR